MNTIYQLLKLNRYIKSPQIKLLAVYLARRMNMRHLSLRIDPVTACNLKCRMCAVGKTATPKIRKFSEADRKRLGRMFFKKALQVVIGCGYEPTLHRQFMHYVSMARTYGVAHVGFTSNGQLLNERHIEAFIRYRLSEITISIHGVQKATYQRFMVNAAYEKLHMLLQNIDYLKKKNNVHYPNLRINFTINSENIDEMPIFFDIFGQYGIQTLQIRPMYGNFYPQGRFKGNDIRKYHTYLKQLSKQCASSNITLMAHPGDLTFNEDNFATIIYPEIFYRIDPNIVWHHDFSWRQETYKAYCRRIKYDKHLICSVFSGNRTLLKRAKAFPASGRFNILTPIR